MVIRLAPTRGGFLRPWLWWFSGVSLGKAPEGSKKLTRSEALPTDIKLEYKEALARATAREGRRELSEIRW
jgi:hypothetical protein